ncbi:hypothetical protein GJ744_001505 [Endocarpon pusillum]|uniref:C2H2-type domain-containing protein n=1 Tax=Endocarpon pusillum TaxID=364733 RepID=A0A8H7DZG2_9EURO|nr:hypothetical protein GJ744_001505 [Endocarpon pusillum]
MPHSEPSGTIISYSGQSTPNGSLHADVHGNGTETEIYLARRMFPKASDLLACRLGKANWQRRLFLRSLRARLRKEKSPTHQMALTPGSSRQFPLTSPQGLPTAQIQFNSKLPPSHRSVLSRISSSRTSTSDSTANTNTFWSKSESLTAETATSVAESDDHGKPSQLTVPAPPVALEKGATFRCQHCCLDIVVGETCAELRRRWLDQTKATRADAGNTPLKSEANLELPTSLEVSTSADWVAHVFADLEPYICTSEPCSHATKTYGSIADWLKHELSVHRLARIWTCQLCHEDFGHSGAFEAHLVTAHQVHPEQASALSSFCERFTGDPPDLDCALCALKCTSVDSFRTHVAGHLEQLALCSIEPDEKAEEELPASPIHQASSADYARLEEFVFSQSRYYSPDVFREHVTNAAPKQVFGQNIISQWSRSEAGKSTRIEKTKRPPMPGRGPSYSFLSNARKQKAKELGTEQEPQRPPVGATPPPRETFRTNPPPRNDDFVGRIGDLDNVHRELSRPGNVCVLNGIGGLGKSALAAEYTYRFAVAYSYIFWVQAETPMICADTFAQIAITTAAQKGTQLPSFDEQRLVDLSQEFLEQTTDRWLLIFDNVDQKLDLRRFLPIDMARTAGSVLITTNKADIGLASSPFTFTQINLGTLTLEESRRLLLSATPGPHQQDAKLHPEYRLAGEIAKRAERLPLALSLIAGYVMVSRCTLADFVDLWNERRKNIRTSLQSSKCPVSETDEAMETLWDIGLREVTSDARKLLNILAFLDPDHIQKDLLVGPHEDPMLELLHVSEAGRYRRMIKELKTRRLIAIEFKNGEEVISIHRKLQARILRDLDKDPFSRGGVFNQVFSLVRSRFPSASPIQVPEPEKWPTCKKYLPHVLSIQRLTHGTLIHLPFSEELAKLFSDGGIDLWERGLTTEGLKLMKSAESILDLLSVDKFQLLRAGIHVIISLLLQDSGLVHIGECHDRIKTALDIRRDYSDNREALTYTRNDEVLLYNAWSDYACVLLQLNMFEEAESIFERCFRQYQDWGNTDVIPYEYAKYYHHVSFCLMYRGSADEAVASAEKGLLYVEQATGKSAAYYRWKFDLACLLLQHPKLLDSSSWQSRTVEMLKDILGARLLLHGKFAFLTLESYYALGATLFYLGNLPDAGNCLRTILEIEKVRPGSCSEVALARTQFLLSEVLLLMEEGSQASQHPTSKSEAATTAAAPVAAAATEQVPAKKASVSAPSVQADQAQPKEASVSSAHPPPLMAQHPPTSGTVSTPAATADRRLEEAQDLARSAQKALDKLKSQTSGPFAQLNTDTQSAAARTFVEENPMVLYDLMQPVFDGRFAGRDAMEYLRLIKKEEKKKEKVKDELGPMAKQVLDSIEEQENEEEVASCEMRLPGAKARE